MAWHSRVVAAICYHPAVLIFVLAVVCGIATRLRVLLSRQTTMRSPRIDRLHNGVVCVVTVVPEGADESSVRAWLSRCRYPHCVRVHLIKAAHPTDPPPAMDTVDCLGVRVHMARARGFDAAVARATVIRRAYADEAFVCTLPHDADVVEGWDDLLMRMLLTCEDLVEDDAVLTTRLLPNGGATFTRATGISVDGALFTEAVEYAELPLEPQPSPFVWAQFMFMRGNLAIRALPSAQCVRVHLEDVIVGRSLWTHGACFFSPNRLVARSSARAPPAPARSVKPPVCGKRRSFLEYDIYMGVANGRLTPRARLGLTPKASNLEVVSKYGQINVLHAMNESRRVGPKKHLHSPKH